MCLTTLSQTLVHKAFSEVGYLTFLVQNIRSRMLGRTLILGTQFKARMIFGQLVYALKYAANLVV